MSEPGTISAATIGNAADEGSAGTITGAGTSSGWPLSVTRRPCAPSFSTRTSAPKWRSMPLGVVARRLGLDHHGFARRREPREQHRGLELRGGGRRRIDDRDRVARTRQGQRQPPAVRDADRPRAHPLERIEHAPLRARAQRGIAIERRGDRAARHGPDHQPAAGAGIAEIERLCRLREARDADPVHAPGALARCARQSPPGRASPCWY